MENKKKIQFLIYPETMTRGNGKLFIPPCCFVQHDFQYSPNKSPLFLWGTSSVPLQSKKNHSRSVNKYAKNGEAYWLMEMGFGMHWGLDLW